MAPAPHFNRIDALLQELASGGQKQAAAGTEAGEYDGTSSHPTAKVPDGTQAVTTGERAAEYTADTKNLIPANSTVDASPDQKSQDGDQNRTQPNIGTHQSAVGEDSSTEGNYKDKTDEPGTKDGETSTPLKYGTEKFAAMSIPQLTSELQTLSARILAPYQAQKTAQAAQAGYSAAAIAGQDDPAAFEKAAAFFDSSLQEALTMAQITGEYLIKKAAEFKRAGMDEATEGEDHSQPGDAASGANPSGSMSGAAGGGDAGAGDAGAGAGGGNEAQLMQMLEQQGGGGPGGPGGPGGAEMQQPASEDELLQAVMELLQQKGITPEMLEQMSQASGAGGGMPPEAGGMPPGGGMPPEAGGMPPGGGMPPEAGGMPPMAAKAASWRKLAYAVSNFQKSGRANNPRRNQAKIAGLKPQMLNTLKDILRLV